MRRYARTEGVLLEPVGHLWAAFSAATGETALLNDETAAILEVLEPGQSESSASIGAALAADIGVQADELAAVVEACWPRLIEAGLVEESKAAQSTTR
jgi:PqqD family protein of HPr-rel-A system